MNWRRKWQIKSNVSCSLICPLRLFAAAHAHGQDLEFPELPTLIPEHLTDLDNFDKQKREDGSAVDRGD